MKKLEINGTSYDIELLEESAEAVSEERKQALLKDYNEAAEKAAKDSNKPIPPKVVIPDAILFEGAPPAGLRDQLAQQATELHWGEVTRVFPSTQSEDVPNRQDSIRVIAKGVNDGKEISMPFPADEAVVGGWIQLRVQKPGLRAQLLNGEEYHGFYFFDPNEKYRQVGGECFSFEAAAERRAEISLQGDQELLDKLAKQKADELFIQRSASVADADETAKAAQWIREGKVASSITAEEILAKSNLKLKADAVKA